jgi:hypothetical protein
MATLAEMLRQGADRLINLPSEAQRFVTNPQAFTQLLTGKNPLPMETGFAAGATGLPAQEMSVLDPNQAPYMQGYTQGEPIGYAAMATPLAIPAVKALAPKANQIAENYMFNQGMMPSIVPPSPTKVADALRQPEKNALGFYSPLDEAVMNLQNQKGTGQQYLAQLLKTQGVKQEEVATRGLDTFLGQNPKVTKTQIEDFLGQNPVQIKETVLDGSQLEPKFKDYTLPNGENYREVLLTLPEKPSPFNTFVSEMGEKYGRDTPRNEWSANDNSTYNSLLKNSVKEEQPFRSGHFDQPNILAHMRVNDRTIDGKKTLFVEEIQSDWHQAGRKQGYATPETKRLTGTVEEQTSEFGFKPEYKVNWEDGTFSGGYGSREAAEARAAEGKSNAKTGVPDAPFKKNWQELAMKRAIQMATEGGYDRVAFTTGKQQADRFDLSKRVDNLLYEKNPNGTYRLSAQVQGQGKMLGDAIPESDLADFVGKEVAEKIAKGAGNKTEVQGAYDPQTMTSSKKYMTELSGVDLQVGGEGMKGFYDKILPDFVNKYGKKHGLKVGKTTLSGFKSKNLFNDQDSVHYFDLTPEAKESFLSKGQPMFAATPLVAVDEETRREMLEKLFNEQ